MGEPGRTEDVARAFRDAMSELASGVVMVTTWLDDKPWGMTVSACCSVSMEPPLMMVSLGTETASARAIVRERSFGVSILGERLIEVARYGAAKAEPKFVGHLCDAGDVLRDGSGNPVVLDAIAHVDCALEREIEAGDHLIVLGLVRDVRVRRGDRPLVFYARTYHRLADSSDLGVGPVEGDTVDSLLYPHPMPTHFIAPRRAGASASGR